MKITKILLFVVLSLFLVGCQAETPAASTTLASTNPPATEVPLEAPTATTEPTQETAPTEAEMVDPAALMANDWQWVSFTSPVEQFEIDMPENYQLIFFDDGTFQMVADCNNAGGAFVDEDGALSIEMFQSTLAVCPGDSRSEQFIELLGSAARYFFEDGQLFIDLMADGGTLAFAPVPVPDLVNTPWQWISFTGNSGHFEVDSPESYVLTLLDDGSLSIVADCNTVLSDYTTDGESLTIVPGATTLALCPDDSRSEQFVQLLVSAERYFIERNNLFVVVAEDGGTMIFAPVSSDDVSVFGQDVSWRWTSFTDPINGETSIDEAEVYTLNMADGTAILAGTCRFAVAEYQVDGQTLTFTYDMPEKNSEDCQESPNEERFFQLLQGAAIYFTEDGNLYIDLMADGGTLVFRSYDPVAAAAEAAREANRVASWDEALEKFLAEQVCLAPGGILLADTPQGRYLNAIGLASTEDSTPITVADFVEIGSNTKSFTTVIALQLQEEGVWSLDDLLQTYLPEQAAKLPYGDQVTLRQLAQNNSGIPDYADGVIGGAIMEDQLERGYTPEELVDYVVENLQPSFEPGQGWEYSTTNFILLGMAAEAVTGQSLDDLYQDRIFDPLEMNDSFLLEGVPETGQIIQGYYTEAGEIKNVTAWNGSQGWAGGGIISTAEDMAKYVAGISSGALFQDPASLEQLLTFGDGIVGPFQGGYGLGVGKWTVEPNPMAWGHGGQTPGFQTLWAVYPELDSQVILLTNSGSCHVSAFIDVLNASPDLFTQELP